MSKVLQIFTVFFTLAFLPIAFADPSSVESESQDFMQTLEAKTILTTEQQDGMKKIIEDSINQREQIIASHQGEKGIQVKKQIRDELETLNGKTQSEVQKVLDQQQYQAYLDVQEAREDRIRDRINSQF